MKGIQGTTNAFACTCRLLVLLTLSLIMLSCAGDPRKVDVQLPESAPELKVTSYT